MDNLDAQIRGGILEYLLSRGKANSVEIAQAIGRSRITVGKYLEILQAHGIVTYEQSGQAKLWRLNKERNTILVIDDDKQVHNLISLLGEDRFHILSAYDGQEGIEKAADADVVILDLMMPKIHGMDVLRHMKSHPLLRKKPVLILSASTNLDQKVKGLLHGADDYITKPFDPLELEAKIILALGSKDSHFNPLSGLPAKSLFIQQLHDPLPFLTIVSIKNYEQLRQKAGTTAKLIGVLARMLSSKGKTFHLEPSRFCIFSDQSLGLDFSDLAHLMKQAKIDVEEHTITRLNKQKHQELLKRLL